MKVIFISRFSSYRNNESLYSPGSDGFFSFGMGQFIAREFLTRGYQIDFENWRSDLRIEKCQEKNVDSVKCRIFPSMCFPKIGEFSFSLLSYIVKESRNKDTVFHFMPNHSIIFHLYAWFVRKRTLISTHIGGPNPWWNYLHHKKISSLLSYLLEKHVWLKSYSNTIAISSTEVDYYRRVSRPVTHMPIFGLSRQEVFFIRDRDDCKRNLGLDPNKILLLQVGRANDNRGFDWVTKLVDHYRYREQYQLLFVGVCPYDDYYEELLAKGATVIPPIEQDNLPIYYNAADLLYYLPHGEMDLAFAGTSYVPLEALACGTPVVATTFHHFPGTEITTVSRIPAKWDDVIPMIDELLNANVSREECRSIVLKHFDWKKVIKKHAELYKTPSNLYPAERILNGH